MMRKSDQSPIQRYHQPSLYTHQSMYRQERLQGVRALLAQHALCHGHARAVHHHVHSGPQLRLGLVQPFPHQRGVQHLGFCLFREGVGVERIGVDGWIGVSGAYQICRSAIAAMYTPTHTPPQTHTADLHPPRRSTRACAPPHRGQPPLAPPSPRPRSRADRPGRRARPNLVGGV